MQTNKNVISTGAQRIQYIDFFKALAMILVILGHINAYNHGIKPWIYAFHMPAFFFVTGLTIKEKEIDTNSFIGIITKYFYRLIVPYLLWGLIFAKLTISNIIKLLYGSYTMISSAGSLTSLWFLPVMYISVILFYTGCWVCKKHINRITVVLMVISFTIAFLLPKVKYGYPFSANIVLAAYGFLLCGYLSKTLIQRIMRIRILLHTKTSAMIYLAMAVICLAGTFLYQLNIPEHGYVLMGNAVYGKPLIFLITAVCGCGMILFLSIALEQLAVGQNVILRWLLWFGQNTLIIFIVQKPIIGAFNIVFSRLHISGAIAFVVTFFGTILLTSLLCIIICRYTPLLAGEKDKDCK